MIDGIAPDIVLAAYEAHPRPQSLGHCQAAQVPRMSFAGEPVVSRIFRNQIHRGRVPFPPTFKITLPYREAFLTIVHFGNRFIQFYG